LIAAEKDGYPEWCFPNVSLHIEDYMPLFQYALHDCIVLIDTIIDEWWLADIFWGIRVGSSPSPSQTVVYH